MEQKITVSMLFTVGLASRIYFLPVSKSSLKKFCANRAVEKNNRRFMKISLFIINVLIFSSNITFMACDE
jgi:hypothetical protein